jgi:hypothetical protein
MPSKMPPSQTGRLHEGDDVLDKKKGIHWKTFKRLHVKYQNYEQQWYREVLDRFPDISEFNL